MATPFPIDFDAIRMALCDALMLATGLDANHVIVLEQETPSPSPRPSKPYVAFKMLQASGRYGQDSMQAVQNADGTPTTLYNYGGPRRINVQFDCYGTSHEEAYGYMTLWQAALDTEPVQAVLAMQSLGVARQGNVADMSILLNTAYEGRAQMECVFAAASNLVVDLGEIDAVSITAHIDGDTQPVILTDTLHLL